MSVSDPPQQSFTHFAAGDGYPPLLSILSRSVLYPAMSVKGWKLPLDVFGTDGGSGLKPAP